jgi:hypothetical protein
MSRAGFEPYIKEQAIEYLTKRFDSEVELASLTVSLPHLSPTKLVFTKGKGVIARVEGDGVLLRHKGRRDVPPMFKMKSFRFEIDLGRVFDPIKHIALVRLDGMEINIPPKGDRPRFPERTMRIRSRPTSSLPTWRFHDAKLAIFPGRKIVSRSSLRSTISGLNRRASINRWTTRRDLPTRSRRVDQEQG